jgi:starch synthase
MDILMVAAELAPYARETDAADAVPALSKALRQLGHGVTVALPRYPAFEEHGLFVARRLTPLPVGSSGITVFDGQLASGVELVLFDGPGLFDRPGVFGDRSGEYTDNLKRMSFLGQAAAALVRQRSEQNKPFAVVHVHDWPGALVAAQLGPSAPPAVLTVHDVRRQGTFPSSQAAALGSDELAERLRFEGGLSALKAGLGAVKAVTTVSPTYGRSFSDPSLGGALSSLFDALPEPVVGVSHGIDYSVYNPATDPVLDARYDAEDPANKARTKGAVLRGLGLELELGRPLLVLAGELSREHGADLVLAALPSLMKYDLALVIAGNGAEFDEALNAARRDYPETFAYLPNLDDGAFRRLNAAADMVLAPARYEPAGTGPMIAARYGAVPIAHATGGHLDTVIDCDPALETGTGFLFESPTVDSLVSAVSRALSAYVVEQSWARLRRRLMRLDLSWDRPARRYLRTYLRLTEGGDGR